jgi:signal peptidase I
VEVLPRRTCIWESIIVKSSTARRAEAAAASTRAGRASARTPDKPARNETWEWIKSLVIAFVLFLVIRTFLIQAYTIPSSSMENTLLIGDYLMANNAIYGAQIPFTGLRMPAFREPENSDIVVFRPEYNEPVIDVVKRVVGSPGDTLQMIDRVVYRNGTPLNEPYLEPNYLPDMPIERTGFLGANCCYVWHLSHLPAGVDHETYEPTRDNCGPLVIPEGNYMLLGDNRDQSLDSRYAGFIPREVIRGKAMFIYYSIDSHADRPFPRLVTAARWGRIGQVIQ